MKGVLHYIEVDLAELDFARELLAAEAAAVLAVYAEFVRQYGG